MGDRLRKIVSIILVCFLAVNLFNVPAFAKGNIFSDLDNEIEGANPDGDLTNEENVTPEETDTGEEVIQGENTNNGNEIEENEDDKNVIDENSTIENDETNEVNGEDDIITEDTSLDINSQGGIAPDTVSVKKLATPSPTRTLLGDEPEVEMGLYYAVCVEGLDEGDSFYVEYSYDGTNWIYAKSDEETGEKTVFEIATNPENGELSNEFWFELRDIPEGFTEEDIVYFRVTSETAEPPMAFITCSLFDWNNETEELDEIFPPDVNCRPDGDENGIYMTVEVPFSHVLLDLNIHYRRLIISASFIDAGNRGILDETNRYIYAYETTSEEDTIARLTEELYNRFIEVPMFGEFGIRDDDPINGMDNLYNRISPIGDSYSIDAEDAGGNPIQIPVHDYEIYWGNDEETGEPLTQKVPVYTLPDSQDILVCVDFDEDEGRGNTFYIRNDADRITFTDDPENPTSAAVIYYDFNDYKTIVAGGNGRGIYDLNTEGLYSFECIGNFINIDLITTTIRVMKPSGTYVVIKGEGEDKKFGNIGYNGFATDVVWATGGESTANVYIGYPTIYLETLGGEVTGVSVKSIKSVKLMDDNYRDGVSIDASDLDKIKFTFAANFYDSIPILITYSDGSEQKLTIQRIGLVIQYQYLGGNPNEDEGDITGELRQDYRDDIVTQYNYNYFAGQQIIITASYYHPSTDNTASGGDDVSLFLTYDSGKTEVLEKTAYFPANGDGVACTMFIIGFAPAKTFDGNVWIGNIIEQTYKDGGFSATVVNSGYDSKTSYSGTQTGSGAGVHWDGVIKWFD